MNWGRRNELAVNSDVQASGTRKITLDDRQSVVGVLKRAFDDDPLMNFLVKQDSRRDERLTRFMDVGLMRLTFP